MTSQTGSPQLQKHAGGQRVWRAAFSGLCATLVGIGLARFAYTPLIPALIEADWFSPADTAYLAAANLLGYLIGALGARRLLAFAPPPVILNGLLILTTVSFVACAWPVSFAWFFLWRLTAGATGGALMVLAASQVLATFPQKARGRAGGVIFTGVGLGIAASGTLLPVLIGKGLEITWLGLAALSLILTALAWSGWPKPAGGPSQGVAQRETGGQETVDQGTVDQGTRGHKTGNHDNDLSPWHPALKVLYAQYALNAVGMMAHMVFLVDYVARGLEQGLAAGAEIWVIFGLGALSGALISGHVADRIGFRAALRLMLALQSLFVGLLLISESGIALAVSSIAIGFSVPGIVPLIAGRVHDTVPGDSDLQSRAWTLATVAFALGQAIAGYGFSYIFDVSGENYRILFAIGSAALALAFVLDMLAPGHRGASSRGA